MGNLYQGSVALGASGGGVGSLEELGVIATATELNYVDGVTSNIQEQLNNKIGLYGNGETDGATGLANLFAAGQTVLSSNQYGDTLPSSASEGTMFFKKATGTVADMDANLVSELMLKAYPVGSVYMSVDSTSPAQLFGGTWTQLKDRFLLGAGDSYSNGATGGQSTIALEESDLPSGTMIFDNTAKTTGWSCGAWSNTHGQNADWYAMPKSQTANQTYTYPTNMPPYLVVYMWKRTA